MKTDILYLAAPYTHDVAKVRHLRFEMINEFAARLMMNDHVVYSPISHGRPIAVYGLTSDWDFWRKQDLPLLARFDVLVILALDGWYDSVGVNAAIKIANEAGMPVHLMHYDDSMMQIENILKGRPIVLEHKEHILIDAECPSRKLIGDKT